MSEEPPRSPAPVIPPEAAKKKYRLGRDRHGGIGAFACTDIPTGMVVLTEKPILLVPENCDDELLEGALLAQLGPPGPARRAFQALADSHARPRPCDKTAAGIIRTNGYPCPGAVADTAGGGRHPAAGGVFPIFSRFNSDCTPNVTHRYCPERNVRSVFTARGVAEGEELLTCYVDAAAAAERRGALAERFGFECACDACTGPDADERDKRRIKIASLDDNIFEHIRHGRYGRALSDIESRVNLLEEEGMDTPEALLRTYNDGYQCCDHSGDSEKALMFLKKVYEQQTLCDDSVSNLEEVADAIKKFEKKISCGP